ncbi:hypothetical protein DY000_02056522 [Brassica cretica]|uniref:SRCR domain-containing protein n=1 Tax=Brassica cretica TaxID=69181 RepID=A0ABQ7AFR7_BRACR|nr:hypothetical protein DY000_02056522 [Brassica cretica]
MFSQHNVPLKVIGNIDCVLGENVSVVPEVNGSSLWTKKRCMDGRCVDERCVDGRRVDMRCVDGRRVEPLTPPP